MSYTTVVINTPMTSADVLDQLNPQVGAPSTSLDRLARTVDGWATKAFDYTSVVESVGSIQSFGLLTVSTTGPTNGQAGTVANVTLTAKTSGADPTLGEFDISATASVVATNIAAAINQTPALSGIVTAVAALAVVTITAVVPGVMGNGIELSAGNLSNVAATAFAHGADANRVTLPA